MSGKGKPGVTGESAKHVRSSSDTGHWLYRSKPHRYLFLLYREPPNLDMNKNDLGGDEAEQRLHFQPSVFAEKHGLTLVGLNWMTCNAD